MGAAARADCNFEKNWIKILTKGASAYGSLKWVGGILGYIGFMGLGLKVASISWVAIKGSKRNY